MLAQSGDTSGGIVIQQLDEDGSDFCRVLPGSVIWVERYGPIYKISHNNLLGGPQRLLAPSASTPRNISMRQSFRPPPGASLGAMGFSFSETGYYTAHYRNPARISVQNTSSEFTLDESPGERTWFAHVPEDPRHFLGAGRDRETVVLGALALDFGNRSVLTHCLGVGVDILPRTALGTTNTFFVPWVAFIRGSDLKEAIMSFKNSRVMNRDTPSVVPRPILFLMQAGKDNTGLWHLV